jgi:cyclic beta-1,2-glucan synthetase
LRRHGSTVSLNPCIPAQWPQFTLEWTVSGTRYRFDVSNPEHRSSGIASAELDGAPVDAGAIPIIADGGVHEVRVVLGTRVGLEEPSHLPLGAVTEIIPP